MGHKVSVIHGVKSDNFYKLGNAVNEIWIGKFELLSRLPFGDSDMGQSGWPLRGYPKIPWHNFIIPLKRRAFSATVSLESNSQSSQAILRQASQGNQIFSRLSRSASFITAVILSIIAVAAYYLPIVLRQNTAPHNWDQESQVLVKKKRWYAVRASVATMSLVAGLMIALLDFHALTAGQHSDVHGLVILIIKIMWALVSTIGFFHSAKAVNSLWADWRDICRQTNDDYVSLPDDFVEEQLPMAVASAFERQRRA